jgi:hypothetical protein
MGFSSPEVMVEEYFFTEAKKYAEQQFLENEMTRYKTEAVKRLYILVDPIYAEQIATTIAYGFDNQLQEAEIIVNKLDLSSKHIASLLEDEEMKSRLIFQDKVEEGMYDNDDY